jgi:hypothetical protein
VLATGRLIKGGRIKTAPANLHLHFVIATASPRTLLVEETSPAKLRRRSQHTETIWFLPASHTNDTARSRLLFDNITHDPAATSQMQKLRRWLEKTISRGADINKGS